MPDLVSSSMRTAAATAMLASCVIGTSACVAAPTSPAHAQSSQRVFLAQPCDALREIEFKDTRAVYLQIASVQSPLGAPLHESLLTNPVNTNQVVSILLRDNQPQKAPWRRCLNESCTEELTGTITAILSHKPRGPEPALELELAVTLPGLGTERATVTAHNQKPVIAPLPTASGFESALVVTPYYLSGTGPESLNELLQCKLRAREG